MSNIYSLSIVEKRINILSSTSIPEINPRREDMRYKIFIPKATCIAKQFLEKQKRGGTSEYSRNYRWGAEGEGRELEHPSRLSWVVEFRACRARYRTIFVIEKLSLLRTISNRCVDACLVLSERLSSTNVLAIGAWIARTIACPINRRMFTVAYDYLWVSRIWVSAVFMRRMAIVYIREIRGCREKVSGENTSRLHRVLI